MFSFKKNGSLRAFEDELRFYTTAGRGAIFAPRFLGSGHLEYTGENILVTAYAGEPLTAGEAVVSPEVARDAERKLRALHGASIVHGDIRPSNIVVNGNEVHFVDFVDFKVCEAHSSLEKDEEMEQLALILEGGW